MRIRANLIAAWLLFGLASSSFAVTHYVDLNSANPTPPYTSWATAATNIQEAADAAAAGDEVVVTNGTYATGGRGSGWAGDGSNRVAVLKALTILSVNGPGLTVIDGAGSMRCVYLTSGSTLSGFTLTNGYASSGAGVWCESDTAVLSNCVLARNSAYQSGEFPFVPQVGLGGGAYQGTFNNCTFAGNCAVSGGGAYGCRLNQCSIIGNRVADGYYYFSLMSFGGYGGGGYGCTFTSCTISANSAIAGGGVFRSTLSRCMVKGNSATGSNDDVYYNGRGGGALNSSLDNCVLLGNSANDAGGGAFLGALTNCTICANFADSVGGALDCILVNCILQFNNARFPDDANYVYSASSPPTFCCTTPMPPDGLGNITNAPLFVDIGSGDLHLQSNSSCINAGKNAYVTTTIDLDGNPRILGGTVDLGAYEYVTPELLVEYLIGLANQSSLSAKRPLLGSLEATVSSLERGNAVSAVNQLGAFQNKVRAQVEPLDSVLAAELNRLAQEVAGVLDAEKEKTKGATQ